MPVHRLAQNPIITPNMDDRMGSNINGPSLMRVPSWVPNPLGQYYLYFAHHQGTYIRLAYADHLEGPWRVHSPGVLDLQDSFFNRHIASPDVHVAPGRQEIWMYYHGCCLPEPPHQFERIAISQDGLRFEAREPLLGPSYWRVFQWGGYHYGLAMPGTFYRSPNGLTDWEQGPTLFPSTMRHSAVRLRGNTLEVYYSRAGDCPERILRSTIELTPDWTTWQVTEPTTTLEPEAAYEGADLSLELSQRGAIHEPARQLRDPCIYQEDGHTYLLYSVAGEHGLAVAELMDDAG